MKKRSKERPQREEQPTPEKARAWRPSKAAQKELADYIKSHELVETKPGHFRHKSWKPTSIPELLESIGEKIDHFVADVDWFLYEPQLYKYEDILKLRETVAIGEQIAEFLKSRTDLDLGPVYEFLQTAETVAQNHHRKTPEEFQSMVKTLLEKRSQAMKYVLLTESGLQAARFATNRAIAMGIPLGKAVRKRGRPRKARDSTESNMDRRVFEARKQFTPYAAIESDLGLTHKEALQAYERERKRRSRSV